MTYTGSTDDILAAFLGDNESVEQVDIYYRRNDVGVHIHAGTSSVRVLYNDLDAALDESIELYENPLKEVPNSASTVTESTQPTQLSLFESNSPTIGPTSRVFATNSYSVNGESEIREINTSEVPSDQ